MYLVVLLFLVMSTLSFGQTKFPLGNGMSTWGVPLKVPESDLALRLGGRFQSLATLETIKDLDTNEESTSQDFFARRVRFQFQAELKDMATFYMDLRNDNANKENQGEKNFNIGDAYVSIPLTVEGAHVLRLYRTKVDVARTETASSSELVFINRPYVADEAAQFVSHNRRATNAQFIGHFHKKISYQLVVGDGVYSGTFHDAKGEKVDSIVKQNFMLGGKVRVHPFAGWEDLKPTETYFGEGKHFSFGAGAFNTSNIRFVEGANEGTVSRTLINAEVSTHYNEWFFAAEYFNMDGVIEDHSAASFNKGSGEGWYVQGEKVFSNYYFLAPFARYEKWNRFVQRGEYDTEASLFGVNWYLNGNRFKVSIAYEQNLLGRDVSGGKEKIEAFHLATLWHF